MSWESAGDSSMRWLRSALSNPAVTIAIGTAVLFAVARVPTEIFYSKFGLRPEDVGLNSVQVLLQGTTTFLVLGLIVALLLSLIFIMVSLGSPRVRSKPSRQSALHISALWVPIVALLITAAMLMTRALLDAGSVMDGSGLHGPAMVPWQAERVEVTWIDEPELDLPGCRWLFYLGEGGGRVVLFDSKKDQTHRIDSDAVQLSLSKTCTY